MIARQPWWRRLLCWVGLHEMEPVAVLGDVWWVCPFCPHEEQDY